VTPTRVLLDGASTILGRPLSGLERGNFEKYLDILLKWQRAHRLVGSSDPVWIVEHLFLDSLLFLRVLPSSVRRLADVGSGAGVPGLPIKIVRSEVEVVLIEARRRRAMFLASAIRAMSLEDASVVEGRLETLGQGARGSFDAVVMRCAGDAESMLPEAATLLRDSGMVIASGPPRPRPLPLGEWITVPGLRAGSSRRFAVYRKKR